MRPRHNRAATLFCVLAVTSCAHAPGDAYSGTVQAESAAVGSPTGGRVVSVLARDGESVRAGQLLVRFDDAQERAGVSAAREEEAGAAAALADARAGAREPDLARSEDQSREARARLESAQLSQTREVDILRGALAQAQAQLDELNADAADAHAQAARARALYATGDVSAHDRDAAVARDARAIAQVNAARVGAANARIQLQNSADVTIPYAIAQERAAYQAAQNAYRSVAAGARPDAIRQAEATVAGAAAATRNAQAKLADTMVRAPADGVVSSLNLHAGDMIAPGVPVATIDENAEPFVRIYIPQSELGRVRVGTRVAVRPDSQPSVSLDGTVEQIDRQAQFTPQNVQSTEDRAALSFGVKVRIHDRGNPVYGGTTVTVSLP